MQPRISIHVDGYYGLMEGVPRLLNLFDKYNIIATFYVNMGREASIRRILKYYAKSFIKNNKKDSEKTKGTVRRYTRDELIKTLLLRRKIGSGHPEMLKEIEKKGHVVEPHCWSHLEWSRDFRKMNKREEIQKMKKSFFECLGRDPKSFAPPMWQIDDDSLKILAEEGFENVCVLEKDASRLNPPKEVNLDVLTFEKTIEELLNEGKSEEEIMKIYEKESKKKNAHVYFHADFEGRRGIDLFEELLRRVQKQYQ